MHKAILSALLAITLLFSPAANAQQPTASGNWAAVQAVPPGDELIIKFKDGQSERGRLMSVTDTALSINRKNKEQTFGRADISQIHHLRRKAEKTKYALIGAGAGAGVGALAGKAKNSPPIDDGEIYVVLGTAIGAGIGAVVGLLFGQGRRKRVLIYQAS